MKVLVVEDDPVDREATVRFLSRLDIETVCVDSIAEATKCDCREKFDLILLDSILPDSCSSQVSRFFAETARSPVVVITGSASNFNTENPSHPLVVIDKNDFAGKLHDTLERIRTKLMQV